MTKRLLVFIHILFFAGAICAQENSARESDSLRYRAFNSQLRQHRSAQPDSALAAADSMIAVARRLSSASKERVALLWRIIIASDQFWIEEQAKSLQALDELLNEKREAFGELANYNRADFLNRKGNFNYQIKNFVAAKEDFEGVILLLKKDSLNTNEKRRLASSYRYLGAIAKEEGQYKEAEGYYRFSLQYTQPNRLANVYKQLGDLQRLQGNQYVAINFYQKAWKLNQADISGKEKISVPQRNRLIYTARDMAESYRLREVLDSANYWLAKAESYHLKDDPELANTLLTKAGWMAEEGKTNIADSTYLEAILALEKSFGKQSIPVATAFRKRAESRVQLGQFEMAKTDLVAAIAMLAQYPTEAEGLRCTQLLCEIYAQKTSETPSFEYIESLQKYAQLGLTQLDELRDSYASDADKQSLMAKGYRLFELALQSYVLQGQEPDYNLIFYYLEKSKNSLLYENWLRGKAEDHAVSGPQYIRDEKELRRQMVFLQERLKEEKDAESETARQLHDRLFTLKKQHQEILNYLETNDSRYQFAHFREPISLPKLQATLPAKKAMLSYFVGDSMTFVLLIQQDETIFFSWKTSKDLKQKVDQMRGGIYQPYLPSFVTKTASWQATDYQQAAHDLYQQLLSPLAEKLPPSLIILPDGPLADLPFAALLTDGAMDSYLIKNYRISYAWSASLWKEMRDRNEAINPPSDHVFALAPAFAGIDSKDMDVRSYHRSFMGPLPFSGKELAAIAAIFDTDTLLGKNASSEAFWSRAEDYRILHLSTHGKANREDPDHSFLAFATPTYVDVPGRERSAEDSAPHQLIYQSHLPLLRLQAEMVVLSACETGTGTTFRGEGIYSLARGFTAAGAGSLVSTLWQVNDQLTASLMQRFYEGLAEGKAKDVALREAQLALIAEGESPFYWAGFTVIGDERALQKNGFSYYWFLLLMIPLGYLFLRKKM